MNYTVVTGIYVKRSLQYSFFVPKFSSKNKTTRKQTSIEEKEERRKKMIHSKDIFA